MNRTFIIAEAGVNHNGSLAVARRLVDAAADCGADAVKFQAFSAAKLLCADAPKAAYQLRTTDPKESQYAMIRRLELSESGHLELLRRCRKRKIMFMSSPFDCASARMLRRIGVAVFKIPSGEITNIPLLRAIGSFRRPVILSSGMSTMAEIKYALRVLAASGTCRSRVTVLHCCSEYPAACEHIHLRAMGSIARRLKVSVGYSDHSCGIAVPIAAVALGATVIEKHFTLSRRMKGPDHAASLEPSELRQMIQGIRCVESALGSAAKKPSAPEILTRQVVRKSIVASRSIARGEFFRENNLACKRPAGGLSPARWDSVIGRVARKDFAANERIVL